MLILDMCRHEIHSKAIGSATEKLARQEGIITLFSCYPGEQSYELPHLQQGAFTYALLEALRGDCQPHHCHAEQLNRYLQQRVPELTQKFGNSQTPWLVAYPYEKGTQILLPTSAPIVTEPDSPTVNLDKLKADALLAQHRHNLEWAEQLWREINRLATTAEECDLSVEMPMEIAQKQQAAQQRFLPPHKLPRLLHRKKNSVHPLLPLSLCPRSPIELHPLQVPYINWKW